MFGFQYLFTDPCPELTKEHQQARKGFECADNEIDLKAGVPEVSVSCDEAGECWLQHRDEADSFCSASQWRRFHSASTLR